ncbi:MAG: DUF6776 family protein [Kangiellaceae bacterium]|jgi:hypothetical protein|nr:DUF6776 family protein [Kangiellaceae bacterium]
MTSDLIITQKRSWLWYGLWGVLALIVLLATFFFGRYDGREQRLGLISERDALQLQVDDYKMRIADLEQQTIMLQSSAQVDAQASEQIMDNISALQKNIDELETELSFYRGLMAPERDIKGLQVSDFILESGVESNQYRFQLVLSQVKEHKIFLKGSANISIVGTLNGKSTRYQLSELASNDLRFTFKYFQNLNGEFTLPEGFEALSVEVSATTRERKPQSVTKRFDWQELTS